MKSLRLIASFLLITLSLILNSCSNEPIDPAIDLNSFLNTGITGTYLLTAFNSSITVDLNGDGIRSTNQLDETNCFNGNTLTLSADNTFIATSKGLDIVTNGTNNVIECFVDPNTTGTWELNGSILSLSYTESGNVYTDEYEVSGSTLTYSIINGEIVGTTATAEPVYLNADIDLVYSKQ